MKSLINIPLLTEQLKRYWAIGAVLLLWYLLFGVLLIYQQSGNDPIRNAVMQARNLIDLLSMNHPVPIFAMLFAPFCAVMALFPYNFASNASGAFHSFPLSKRQLFWTNTAAALVLMLLPLLIFCLFLLMPIHYPITYGSWSGGVSVPASLFPRGIAGGAIINTIPVIAGFFLRVAVGIIFYYSVFLLAVSVSGNRLVAVLLCGALPLVPLGLHGFIDLIGYLYVFGHGNTTDWRLASTAVFSNPVAWGSVIETRGGWLAVGARRLLFPLDTYSLLPYFIVYIATTAALTAIAFTCSKRRKLERTGDSVVFTPLTNTLVFILAMLGMMSMGAFMLALMQSRVGLYIGFVIGFVIAYFMAQMIAEKSFDVRHKAKALIPFGATMIALYLMMLATTNFIVSPLVNRVPAAQEVAGVALHGRWMWMNPMERPDVYTRDPETIARTLEIHQYIVDNRRQLSSLQWSSLYNWRAVQSIPFAYLMQDGTTKHWRYTVSHDFMISSGLYELINSPEMIMAEHPTLRRPEMIESINISFWDQESLVDFSRHITRPEEIATLAVALKADLAEDSVLHWHRLVEFNQTGIWPDVEEDHVWINASIWSEELRRGHNMHTDHVHLGNYAGNTMAWLAEHGLLE